MPSKQFLFPGGQHPLQWKWTESLYSSSGEKKKKTTKQFKSQCCWNAALALLVYLGTKDLLYFFMYLIQWGFSPLIIPISTKLWRSQGKVRGKILKENKTLTTENQQTIKLEIRFPYLFEHSWHCFDGLLLAILSIVHCISFSAPSPPTFVLIHSAYNIYSHISISLRKDQSFSSLCCRDIQYLSQIEKRRKENLRLFPSAVFLLWNHEHPSPPHFAQLSAQSKTICSAKSDLGSHWPLQRKTDLVIGDLLHSIKHKSH